MQSPENMKNATDEQTRHDLELINQNAEQLNAEMEDVLSYQLEW